MKKNIRYQKISYDSIQNEDSVLNMKNRFEIRVSNTPILLIDGYILYNTKENDFFIYLYGYINTENKIERNIKLKIFNDEFKNEYKFCIENILICNYEIFETKIL